MFNSDARTQMCPNDRNWPQLDLNQCKWAQITVNISKWPQITWMQPIIGQTFVKSLPVMHVSVRHKVGRPPNLVCTTLLPLHPSTTSPLKSNSEVCKYDNKKDPTLISFCKPFLGNV